MNKKNILEFCLSPDLGGLEIFMVHCYEYFTTQSKTHIIISDNSKLDNYLTIQPNLYIKRNKFLPIVPALKLAKYIDKHDIDIIHFHWTKDITTVVLAKLLSKKNPCLIQTRNMTMTRFKNDFYHKWLYKNIHTMHAVTHQVKEQIRKYIPKDICPRVKVIYMGTREKRIDVQLVEELKIKYNLNNNFIVGIIGRIQESKGQFMVIEALAQLQTFNIKALIVGHTMNEEYLQALKQKVTDLGIEEKIVFTGFTKAVNEHMSLCDVTVLATPKETFGLVVIESMINKTPVIATNNGGPLEIIENDKDGILFNRTTKDLVKKIGHLYENPSEKEKLSFNAYAKAKEKFNQKFQLEKLYEVCQNLR